MNGEVGMGRGFGKEKIRSKDIGSHMWRKGSFFFFFFFLVSYISRTLDIATFLAPKDVPPGVGFIWHFMA